MPAAPPAIPNVKSVRLILVYFVTDFQIRSVSQNWSIARTDQIGSRGRGLLALRSFDTLRRHLCPSLTNFILESLIPNELIVVNILGQGCQLVA